MRRTSWLPVVVLAACTTSTAPAPPAVRTDAQLHIVRADSLPPLLDTVVQFWAKAGTDTRGFLYYQGAAPGDTGDVLLEFDVPSEALLRRPDGGAFQPGDSVLITIAIPDSTHLGFTFSPSGLVFNPNAPAHIHLEYAHANDDYNDDGVTDSTDTQIRSQLDLWRRESGDTLWTKTGAVNLEDDFEVDENVYSFTEYALAW